MAGSDTESGTFLSYHDWLKSAPSITIIEAIAAIENIEPIDLAASLDTTLFDHIDPEALDTLVTHNSQITISFTLNEYQVQIHGNELAITHDTSTQQY